MNFVPENWNPNANVTQYSFNWITEDSNDAPGVIAHVVNESNPAIDIPVVIDDLYMYENNLADCALNINEAAYESGCRIVIARPFCVNMMEEEEDLYRIWREVGRYHMMHHFADYAKDAYAARKKYYKAGEIPPAELAADLFTLLYMEKNDMLKSLQKVIRQRNKFAEAGDESATMVWTELRLRKGKVREIEKEDEILAELISLCGVESIEEV